MVKPLRNPEYLQRVKRRLAAARELTGRSPAEISRLLDIPLARWWNWENGKYLPDLEVMLRFTKIAGVDLNFIYSGERRCLTMQTRQALEVIFPITDDLHVD
jgi:transcriptional regulator with XRE-family HTH domain